MDKEKHTEFLKTQLKNARVTANQYKRIATQFERELESLGVYVPTAADPLCLRGNDK
jgi:hypothetical protein